MKCKYCQTYYDAPDRRLTKTGDKVIFSERFCRTAGEYKAGDNKACDRFSLANSFWCNKEDNWLNIQVCINRQNNGYCSPRCKQGKEILSASRRKTVNGLKRRTSNTLVTA